MKATMVSLREAHNRIRFKNSYTRLDAILPLWFQMDRGDWFELLGEYWSICDNIGARRGRLRRLLTGQPRQVLDRMMTTEELAALAELPERIPVWRGCYEHNVNGLSWSTERDVAARFPFMMRYRANTEPLLVHGFASRKMAVLKLDRDELEIIAPCVKRVTISVLTWPAA